MKIWCLLRVLQKDPLCKVYDRALFESLLVFRNSLLGPHKKGELDKEVLLEFWKEHLPRIAERALQLESNMLKEEEKFSSAPQGIHLCHLLDPSYPRRFLKMESAPFTFQYYGRPSWNEQPLLGIVGSREPTELTMEWMKTEAYRFIKDHESLGIASGGARGVDQVAHQLALASQKPTFAWLPSGLSRIYPDSLRSFTKQILDGGGALLSEFDHDVPLRKHHFHIRNRLISGMVDVLLVPQASARSGTLMTAHTTLELGRPLLVLPGHPLIPSYAGNLELLQFGGVLIRNRSDLNHYSDLFPKD